MALEEQVAALSNNIKGMALSLDKFDGTSNFKDWEADYDILCQDTNRVTDRAKLNLLVFNLRGQAKEVYLALNEEDRTDFAKVRQALLDAFQEQDSDRQQRKMALYARKQVAHETLKEYVLAAQRSARGLGMPQSELVAVSVNNTRPQVRRHLKGHKFQTVAELLKSDLMTEDFNEEDILHQLMTEVKADKEQPTVAKAVTWQGDDHPRGACQCCGRQNASGDRRPGGYRGRSRERPQYKQYGNQSNGGGQQLTKDSCGKCGRVQCQGGSKCFAHGKTCHKCGKQNHLRNVCRSKTPQRP